MVSLRAYDGGNAGRKWLPYGLMRLEFLPYLQRDLWY